jgi:hypothetical protein
MFYSISPHQRIGANSIDGLIVRSPVIAQLLIDPFATSQEKLTRSFINDEIQTGFTGFFRICKIKINPEKSCKSCLFY